MAHPISLATEGLDDEAVAQKLCAVLAIPVKATYPARGKARLDAKLPAYNEAAALGPWLVLRDLDFDAPCPGELCKQLLRSRASKLLVRIPVRTIESWLLADSLSLAGYLRISRSLIPADPDALDRPKQDLVNLARRSRSRPVREAMVPPEGHTSVVGPGYTASVIAFVREHWDPLQASQASESLRRCLDALRGL
jgi:hypothetical protein